MPEIGGIDEMESCEDGRRDWERVQEGIYIGVIRNPLVLRAVVCIFCINHYFVLTVRNPPAI